MLACFDGCRRRPRATSVARTEPFAGEIAQLVGIVQLEGSCESCGLAEVVRDELGQTPPRDRGARSASHRPAARAARPASARQCEYATSRIRMCRKLYPSAPGRPKQVALGEQLAELGDCFSTAAPRPASSGRDARRSKGAAEDRSQLASARRSSGRQASSRRARWPGPCPAGVRARQLAGVSERRGRSSSSERDDLTGEERVALGARRRPPRRAQAAARLPQIVATSPADDRRRAARARSRRGCAGRRPIPGGDRGAPAVPRR